MKIIKTKLDGVMIVEPEVFGDHRGWFYESWSEQKYKKYGINAKFVQDNHSFSAKKGTLRGLHYQKNPNAQAKLVRCPRGGILDVAVDIRKGSPTYSQWVSVELSEENRRQLFIPRGFAHGVLTLTNDTEILYKADGYYAPDHDRSLRWNDPAFGISWGVTCPILSYKDKDAPLLLEADINFIWEAGFKE